MDTVRTAVEKASVAFSVAVAYINAVLHNGSDGYGQKLSPVNVEDNRRALITAHCSGGDCVVRINVAPGRVSGSGTMITHRLVIGPVSAENAARAVQTADTWYRNALSVGFGVKDCGPRVDAPVVKWMPRGGKGRGTRGVSGVSSNPFETVEAPVANVEAPAVDIVAGMSASANVEAPAANVEAPAANVEPPVANVEPPVANVEPPVANVEPETVGAGTGRNRNRR